MFFVKHKDALAYVERSERPDVIVMGKEAETPPPDADPKADAGKAAEDKTADKQPEETKAAAEQVGVTGIHSET